MNLIYKPSRKKYINTSDAADDHNPNTDADDLFIESCFDISESTLEYIRSKEIMRASMWDDKNKLNNHPRIFALQYISVIFSFASALIKTINGDTLPNILFWYGLTIILSILFNTLSIAGSFLAFPNRISLSILIGLTLIGVRLPSESPYLLRYWMAVSIYGIAIILIIVACNSKWLYDERYRMDTAVSSTIVGSPENTAVVAFKYGGMDECRTVALRHNLQFTEDLLYGLFGDFWRCGYASGYKKTEQYNADLKKANDAVDEIKRKYDDIKHQLKEVNERNKFLERERQNYEKEIEYQRNTRWFAEKTRDEIKDQNTLLLSTNEELAQALHTEKDAPVIKKVEQTIHDNQEKEAMRLLKDGKSIAAVSEQTGISFANVNTLRQQVFPDEYYTDETGKVRSKKGRNGKNKSDQKIIPIKEASNF